MNFRNEVVKIITRSTKLSKKKAESLITIPPNFKLGDYAFPCFSLGKNPHQIAEKLKKKVKLPKSLAKVEAVGPYLNFFVNQSFLAEETLKEIYKNKENYGQQNIGKEKVIVMDYSHPNIAKPFGIGHLRSTVIGNSLYKTFKFLGYKPVSANHLGDWGTQFGKLIVAYQKWGKKDKLGKDVIKYLLKLYVRFHREAEKNDALNEQAREVFKHLEEGNEEYLELWQSFKDFSLEEFQKIYTVLDVVFDSYKGEAFVNNLVPAAINKLKKKVKTKLSDGALIIDLENYKMPPVLLLKSDGATTYHSRDIAAVFYRFKEYKASKLIYIVGSEQKLYFRQLFKVLELFGYNPNKFTHVEFGLFKFPEGRMSTRKGKVIFLEDVLQKAIDLAERIIREKNPKLKNREEVAKMVGVGAVIFGDLSNDRVRDINFDWKKILSFEGETAPYVQYTHARACSILRKAKREYHLKLSTEVNFDKLQLVEEQAVVKQLYLFPEILLKVVQSYKPHHLAQYLVALAQSFNEFYHKCPVLSEQKQTMRARLLLVDSVRQVIRNGLYLLGIKAPEEM